MKKNTNLRALLLIIVLFVVANLTSAIGTFTNPIKSAPSADPWVLYEGGYYYLLVTTSKSVWIHKSDRLETLGSAPRVKVWSAPDGDIVDNTWAPELHYLNGRWYVYTCGNIATDGTTKMRMIVLQGDAVDPLKPYTYVASLSPNQMAIDASVWQDPSTNKIYMTWSQWAPDQSIYIAELTTPTTLGPERIKLSEPTAAWEVKGWNVNEGPTFIKRNNKLHIIFSVSGCSTSDYGLARLTCSDGNYLNASSWTKCNELVFARNEENKVWGVGHNGFTKSPDGTEDWLVYHAKLTQIDSNSDRCTRIQPFTWDANDNPVFGEPYPAGVKLPNPSDGKGTKQTISFTPIANKVVGDESFNLTATASSGLPVTYYLQSGPATLVDGTIRLTGVPGTVRVFATQDGNDAYCAAWPVFMEFKVTGPVNTGIGNGLNGIYYNGKYLETKVLERIDSEINFAWSTNSPAAGVNSDNFSAQWKGYIVPLYSEVYRFSIVSDNGRRLKIDNTVIIDQLRDDAGKEYIGSIYLEAGKQYPIELTYYEVTGSANIKLKWWSNSQGAQIVPKNQLYTDPISGIDQGVSEITKLQEFPNPAQNFITIKAPSIIDSMLIYNQLGSIVRKIEAGNTTQFTCNLQNFTDGIYFVSVNCNNTIYTDKIVVRK